MSIIFNRLPWCIKKNILSFSPYNNRIQYEINRWFNKNNIDELHRDLIEKNITRVLSNNNDEYTFDYLFHVKIIYVYKLETKNNLIELCRDKYDNESDMIIYNREYSYKIEVVNFIDYKIISLYNFGIGHSYEIISDYHQIIYDIYEEIEYIILIEIMNDLIINHTELISPYNDFLRIWHIRLVDNRLLIIRLYKYFMNI